MEVFSHLGGEGGGIFAVAVLHGLVGGAALGGGLEVSIGILQARVGSSTMVAHIGTQLRKASLCSNSLGLTHNS